MKKICGGNFYISDNAEYEIVDNLHVKILSEGVLRACAPNSTAKAYAKNSVAEACAENSTAEAFGENSTALALIANSVAENMG
jgi:hypothetical protein